MFDTLTAVRKLEAAGINTRQAEAVVAVIRSSEERAATKADLSSLKTELEASMLKVALGIVVANVSLTVALVKLL